ncbi:MAG: general secretion pathway protein A [Gammaproteobacteria bacterium]|jgi:general secretion pathway protein A
MDQSFYNFYKNPFLLTADPSFFFKSSTHKKALSYLLYGLEQEEGFIVVIGEVGTGKTTLVGYLLNQIQNKNLVVANIVTSNLKATDILRMIMAEFKLDDKARTKAQYLKSLNNYFQSCVDEGKRVLLIIDEAQNLPKESLEELRMLSNMQSQGRQLLQCYLLGQIQLKEILESNDLKQLRQRIIATHYLKPLTLQETYDYMKYRLSVAGWKNDPQLDKDVIIGIYHYTRGIPRIINLLCGRILLYGQIEELHRIDYHAFEQVLEDVKEELWSKD